MNSDELKQQIQEVWLSHRVCDSFYSLGKRQPVSEEFYEKLVRWEGFISIVVCLSIRPSIPVATNCKQ